MSTRAWINFNRAVDFFTEKYFVHIRRRIKVCQLTLNSSWLRPKYYLVRYDTKSKWREESMPEYRNEAVLCTIFKTTGESLYWMPCFHISHKEWYSQAIWESVTSCTCVGKRTLYNIVLPTIIQLKSKNYGKKIGKYQGLELVDQQKTKYSHSRSYTIITTTKIYAQQAYYSIHCKK